MASAAPALQCRWACDLRQLQQPSSIFSQQHALRVLPLPVPSPVQKRIAVRSHTAQSSKHVGVDKGQDSKLNKAGRREALLAGAALLMGMGGAAGCPENASALGSSFLKDRLIEAKKGTFQNLLYPIEASRIQLQKVHEILDSASLTPALFSEARDLVQVSSRDCMPLEHYTGSQGLQAKFFEVCTFKLLVKNAVSLIDRSDPKRVRTETALTDLNRAFAELDDVLAASLGSTSQRRDEVLPVVVSTQQALDELENGIRDALGVPPRLA